MLVLGTQFGEAARRAFFAPFVYLGKTSLRPSRRTLGGSGTQSTTTVWTSPTPCPSGQSRPACAQRRKPGWTCTWTNWWPRALLARFRQGSSRAVFTPLLLVPGGPSPGSPTEYVRTSSRLINGWLSISISSMIPGGTGPNLDGQSGLACWT